MAASNERVVNGTAIATVAITITIVVNAIRELWKQSRIVGITPVARKTTRALKMIASRLVRNSSPEPRASTIRSASSRIPVAASGGTRATATATPGSAPDMSSRAVA